MKQPNKCLSGISAILLLTFTISSCATNMNFATSTVVPSAEGSVKVDRDDNGNYNLNLKVKRLADPKRLQPAKSMYIVWLQTENDGIKNLGQLKSITGFFTDAQTASLHTTTPFKPKQIFITAEDDASISNPGSQVVMTTK
ncbi:hypothetical protein LJ707_18130 [Mucilaginibacter sp. UR6-1]|uniref:hypothetical protein n=1 Tax=Mucilaginibacter sp. UR6-1 TaxID=1435643 RepID=UPI001E5615A8|nr:hypothetical protein [Mucilaginibacter sp. UR6-1]MCC8410867.1 hypothetical protein [Mucilaginibacter sp. UR6-1]